MTGVLQFDDMDRPDGAEAVRPGLTARGNQK